MKKLLFAAATLLLPGLYVTVSGQACAEFYEGKYCTIPGDLTGFQPLATSRSALLEINMIYKYTVTLACERDYKIGICTEPGYNPVRFRLLDAENNAVLYDNSLDDYIESIGFTVLDNSKRFILEITVLAKKLKPRNIEDVHACAGILILYKDVGKIGFE